MAGCCEGSNVLIYSCAGAADVGKLADDVARKMAESGMGKMSCIAAIGAGISGYVESVKGSDKNIAIDGCGTACARKILEKTGAITVSHIMTELGFIKGKTLYAKENAEKVISVIKEFEGFTPDAKNEGRGGCSCGGKC
jgi:uncharacterized metal-binding protein